MAVSLNIDAQVLAVPHESPNWNHAICMPDTIHPVSRLPMNLSQAIFKNLVLMSFKSLDTCTMVHLCSSFQFTPDAFKLRLFPCRSPHGLLTNAAHGGLRPIPADRPRRAKPSSFMQLYFGANLHSHLHFLQHTEGLTPLITIMSKSLCSFFLSMRGSLMFSKFWTKNCKASALMCFDSKPYRVDSEREAFNHTVFIQILMRLP